MKSIVFFNNKGGVGKTTLACNLASYLNIQGKKTLLIDADPQCNATQAILSEEECENIYLSDNLDTNTLYKCLAPLTQGEASIETNIIPISRDTNNYFIDLVPGHPRLSMIEDILSDGWSELKGQAIRGFRITNWCHYLIQKFSSEYDYIIFDVGPSLGALNRSVILSCDYLVTPFGCDIFSLLGIKNIASWIKQWDKQYKRAIDGFNESDPNNISNFNILENTDNKFRFAGYSVQQYVTRKFKEGPRPVKAYDKIMQDIPKTVNDSMSFLYPKNNNKKSYQLGHIPYLHSLIPMSQSSRVPIHKLKSSDGLVGSQFKQVKEYSALMESIYRQLLNNIGDETL